MENLRVLQLEFFEVWHYGFLGLTLGQVTSALGILLAFFLIRGLLARVAIRRLEAFLARYETPRIDKVLTAVKGPLTFVPVILGIFFAKQTLALTGTAELIGKRLVLSLAAFTVFWLLFRLVDAGASVAKKLDRFLTTAMIQWLGKALEALLVIIGFATLLEIWGIQVAPILAGLGLFGVAVALGAQDLFKNLIASILVIAERRFEPGHWIRVDGVVEGTVESIGFRSTLVRRFDKAPVYVPNAHLAEHPVTNFSEMTHRRIYWHLGIEYGATIEQLKTIRDGIENYVLGNADFAKPPAVATFVRIDRFSDSSIDIMLYCFTRTTNWGEWLKVKEQLAYRIKEIVEDEAGSAFAFPSQSVYVESLPEGRPEPFVPPGEKVENAVG